MYSDDRLNRHYILRYGLTHEFFQAFHELTYLDIEIPLTLVRHFHIWIQPFVDAKRVDDSYVKQMQKKHRLYTMKDVQTALSRGPKRKWPLPSEPRRKAVLMPATFAPLVQACFHDQEAIMHVLGKRDREAWKTAPRMENSRLYDIAKEMGQVRLSKQTRGELRDRLEKLVLQNIGHELFGRPDFKRWLQAHSFRSAKMIDALDRLIREQPVGIVLDQVEITISASILSLLAKKYGLPFIHMPQALITDRSLLPTRASHYCVWGRNYKEWLQKRGVSPSKIQVVGNWKFELANRSASTPFRAEFISRLGIPDTHSIVTYTTQPFSLQVNQTVMDWIRQVSTSFPTVTFLIRPHPYDSCDYSSHLSNLISVPTAVDLYQLLAHTDILMTISSNTAIEAAMLGKGIFVLQPPIPYHYELNNNDFNVHLVKAGAGPSITSPADLRENLEKGTTDPAYRTSLLERGQRFLQNTLQMHPSPSNHVMGLIDRLLRLRKYSGIARD